MIEYAVFALVFLLTLLLLNALVGLFRLPTYGVWTGNIPLEHKLSKLREFAKAGPVDAVIMGSSIADNGFSAETFSLALSQTAGKPVRVFNMATGAGDWQMFPILYKLTRLYAQPKQLYLLHPGSSGTGNDHVQADTLWPDGQFMYSNAGRFIKYPAIFRLSEAVWMSPLINASGAARDLALYGRYKRMPSSSLLSYPYNQHGDKISHFFMHDETQFNAYRGSREKMIISSAAVYEDNSRLHDCNTTNPFFSRDDLQAIRELKAQLASDRAELILVSQEPSAGFGIESSAYQNALNIFFKSAAQECLKPEKIVYPVAFLPTRYEIEDTQHLNVHGARRLALTIAAKLGRETTPNHKPVAFFALKRYPTGPDFHHEMGVILSGASDQKTIDVTYHTLDLAPIDLVALRTPGVLQLELLDRDGIVHTGAAITSDGKTISFIFSTPLPSEPTAFLSRLVELYPDGRKHYLVVPIQQYVWTN